jgi:hypothetical protein
VAGELERKDKDAREGNRYTREVEVEGDGFFRKNPTLVLSLLYIYATAIGIVYSLGLYGSFRINIFDYSEIPDFLLAAFKNVWIGLNLAIQVLGVFVLRRYLPEGTILFFRRSSPAILEMLIFFYVCLVAAITYGSAITMASSIKAGDAPTVDVRYRSFSGSAGQMTEPGLELIGTTQKAAFFYDVDGRRTIVIPQSQIVSIEVPE